MINWRNPEEEGATALHIAVIHGQLEVVRDLVTTPGVALNLGDNWGRSPADVAAEYAETVATAAHAQIRDLLAEVGAEHSEAHRPLPSAPAPAPAHAPAPAPGPALQSSNVPSRERDLDRDYYCPEYHLHHLPASLDPGAAGRKRPPDLGLPPAASHRPGPFSLLTRDTPSPSASASFQATGAVPFAAYPPLQQQQQRRQQQDDEQRRMAGGGSSKHDRDAPAPGPSPAPAAASSQLHRAITLAQAERGPAADRMWADIEARLAPGGVWGGDQLIVNFPDPERGDTPLHLLACSRCPPSTLDTMLALARGSAPTLRLNKTNRNGESPMDVAIVRGRFSAARQLRDAGAREYRKLY